MASDPAAQNAQMSDLLKTMLMKQGQHVQSNNGQPQSSGMERSLRMGIRPGLIKREPGLARQPASQPQHGQVVSRPQVSQSGSPNMLNQQNMTNSQIMPHQRPNSLPAMASMTQFNIQQRPRMSSAQLPQQMQQVQQEQQQQQSMTRGSSPQMAPAQGMRMPQNLTPQQQAMMIRYQQQMRQQQMQQGVRPQIPPNHMMNRPRMPVIKQEPGTGPQLPQGAPQPLRGAQQPPQRAPQLPQMVSQQAPMNRGPMPLNVRPPTQGLGGVQAPQTGPVRGMLPVQVKQEGVPISKPQRQFPGMPDSQRFPIQGQMLGNPPLQPNQLGQLPGNRGNPPQAMVQTNMMGQGQHVRQVVPNQRRGGRNQARARMQQPPGSMPRLQGQAPGTNFMNPRMQMVGIPNRQINPMAVRTSMTQAQMNEKTQNSVTPTTQSQSSTSFMQMLTDDSDLMNLMSSQSQYTGLSGDPSPNSVFSSSGLPQQGPQNANASSISFMQLLNDSRTPPPDPDQRQNFMAEQHQLPNQMRMPMPTPPMSDPMSGSPNEYGQNHVTRGNMVPVSSGISSQMTSSGIPFQSGEHLPPPYPGGPSMSAQRPGGLNQNNIMYPSSTSSQMYSCQQSMPHTIQSQMGLDQMQVTIGSRPTFTQHQQQMGAQGLSSFAQQQMYRNHLGTAQSNPNQQLGYQSNPVGDPFSPSIIPPNRDISLNPPQDQRMQVIMDRVNEYMDMDNMHDDMVEPIIIAPIDERIAAKMDHFNPRQDMMSLQNMVNRLDNQGNDIGLPVNQNVPLPPVESFQRCDPFYNALENELPDVQLLSAHGDFHQLTNQQVAEPPPPRSNLSANSHKLLKSMKKLKLVLKKIDLKGRTTVRLGRKRSKRKEKERRRRHRKEHRSKKWRHIDRSHIYERRRKKRESISVSSDSDSEDSEYQSRRRRREKRRKRGERYKKRRSLSSEGSYVSEDDLDMDFKPKKRRTRAKKPQYYLGSDDEFEYESSLTGYIYDTSFDWTSPETNLRSKSPKKVIDESDFEFDPGELTSDVEESDASGTESSSESDSETRSDREKRISKKKQTSLRVAQRFRSSSSDEMNEMLFFDSDDEEYTPAAVKRARKSHARHSRKRRRSLSDSMDESLRHKKKRQKRSQKLASSSDGEDFDEKPVIERLSKVSPQKSKTKSTKSEKQKVAETKKSEHKKVAGAKKVSEAKRVTGAKKANSPPKPKGKAAGKVALRSDKATKADSTKEAVETVETQVTRVTRRVVARQKELESQEPEGSPEVVTRRTRSQLRRDSNSKISADADKSLNVVSTSEEVSGNKNVQNPAKNCESQAEVSSTSENPDNQETNLCIQDHDESPKVVTSTSESKKLGKETCDKETESKNDLEDDTQAAMSSVDTTEEQKDSDGYKAKLKSVAGESMSCSNDASQSKAEELENKTCVTNQTDVSCELKDSELKETATDPLAKETATEPLAKETATDPLAKETATEPLAKETATEPLAKETATEPLANETATEPLAKETATDPLAKETATEPLAKETATEPLAKETATEPLAKETATEPLAKETATEPLAEETATEPLAKETATEPLAIETATEPLAKETLENSKKRVGQISPSPLEEATIKGQNNSDKTSENAESEGDVETVKKGEICDADKVEVAGEVKDESFQVSETADGSATSVADPVDKRAVVSETVELSSEQTSVIKPTDKTITTPCDLNNSINTTGSCEGEQDIRDEEKGLTVRDEKIELTVRDEQIDSHEFSGKTVVMKEPVGDKIDDKEVLKDEQPIITPSTLETELCKEKIDLLSDRKNSGKLGEVLDSVTEQKEAADCDSKKSDTSDT